MKYLVLFDLGQKRIVSSFNSRTEAIEKINATTRMADDVIYSITEDSENKFTIYFKDGTPATLRIVKSEDENPLGYYHMDFYYFMTKLRNILIARRIAKQNELKEQARNKKMKRRARSDAFGMILAGLACILAGFALAAIVLVPAGMAWQFAGLGSMALLGLVATIRGSYILINPKSRFKKLEKYAKA